MSSRFSRTIYVGNLPDDVKEREVEDLFYKVQGTFGLIDYTNYEDMKYAIPKLDDTEFRNPWARGYIRVKGMNYDGGPSRSRSSSRSFSRSRSWSLGRERDLKPVDGDASKSPPQSRSASPVKPARLRSRSRSASPRQVRSGSD